MLTYRHLKNILFFLLLLCGLPSLVLAVDCFQCHDPNNFTGPVVHSPVEDNDCLSCHAPHVSRQQKLLLQDQKGLCLECHEQIAETLSSSAALHAPVRDGECSACHSPHVSAQAKLLKFAGGELCFFCHQESKKDYPVSHPPFSEGECSSCHASHGGDDQRMLKQTGSGLCFECHDSSSQLKGKHLNLDLQQVDCLTCHHPHGGKTATLLRAVSHQPFADGECDSCHADQLDADSCLQCHEDQLSSFNYAHTHLGIAGPGNPCITCHNPHVADRQGLLPANVGSVCRACHAGTFARQEKSLHKHSGWSLCTDCHDLHGSNHMAMLKPGSDPESTDVCSLCHDQHKGFTHPIGEGVLDPRNNQAMDCLTCHNGNDGSNYRYFLRGSGERGLCVQCHQSY